MKAPEHDTLSPGERAVASVPISDCGIFSAIGNRTESKWYFQCVGGAARRWSCTTGQTGLVKIKEKEMVH
jgi:hypothetical protein